MKKTWAALVAAGLLIAGGVGSAEETKAPPDPALRWLGKLVGGRWVGKVAGPQGEMPVEARYSWALGGKVIHAVSRIGVGTPMEMTAEAFYGWDPGRKEAYYLDMHGHQDVFHGTVKMNGDVLETDFRRLVGPPAHWFATDELTDPNTMVFTLHVVKDGQKQKLFALTTRRVEDASAPLPAPPTAPAADVDATLKALGVGVGGKWRNTGGQVELGYAWGPGGRTLRGSGTIFGAPVEARYGWDPVKKQVFYLDFHGPERVFFGHARAEGGDVITEFRVLVGPNGAFRSKGKFAGDTYEAQIESTLPDRPESHRVSLARSR
jgi:hypothetical protein